MGLRDSYDFAFLDGDPLPTEGYCGSWGRANPHSYGWFADTIDGLYPDTLYCFTGYITSLDRDVPVLNKAVVKTCERAPVLGAEEGDQAKATS